MDTAIPGAIRMFTSIPSSVDRHVGIPLRVGDEPFCSCGHGSIVSIMRVLAELLIALVVKNTRSHHGLAFGAEAFRHLNKRHAVLRM